MNMKELPRWIDLSCVQTVGMKEDLERMVYLAKKYEFICCFSMPCYTEWLVDKLKDAPKTVVGGAVGFPSGADLTESKVLAAVRQREMGCGELDMVINVSALKNREYDLVKNDIRQVKEAAQDLPLKVILEVAYLEDYEICKGAELAVECGANYVKTGTGWANKPTVVDHIRLIKDTIGTSAKIKAAGGVRDLNTLLAMIDAGCTRFGIGLKSAENIMREAGIFEE